MVSDPRDSYWWPTSWRISRETFLDRQVANAMNADNELEDAEPFGAELVHA